MNQSTSGLEQRYKALRKVFPQFGEAHITIFDFGDWGVMSFVEEYGEVTSYDYDVEHPERYCPNRADQLPEHAEQHAAYQAECARVTAESQALTGQALPEDETAPFTRRDYEPPPASDPVLEDHLTKYGERPPQEPPLWETHSQTPPVREGKSLVDPKTPLGIPPSGRFLVLNGS